MKTITAIETQRNRIGRLNVFLDGEFAFSLSASLAAEAGLSAGKLLSEAEIGRLLSADIVQRAREAGLRLLGGRPRSKAELRERLARHGFDADTVERALSELQGQGLVDDEAFARFWTESRETFSPRSQRLLKLELKRKGVAEETIAAVAAEVDDARSAYEAARRKLRSGRELDYERFRRRLLSFLRQRGFRYEVISDTMERLWHEYSAQLDRNKNEVAK